MDAAGHVKIATFNSSIGPAECCSRCRAIAKCDAYAWGRSGGLDTPEQCFLLGDVTGTKAAEGRTFGCVRMRSTRATESEVGGSQIIIFMLTCAQY